MVNEVSDEVVGFGLIEFLLKDPSVAKVTCVKRPARAPVRPKTRLHPCDRELRERRCVEEVEPRILTRPRYPYSRLLFSAQAGQSRIVKSPVAAVSV